MEQQRSTPSAETASKSARPAADRIAPPKAEGPGRAKGQVFRRKIDCGGSTETSAERLVLRDPGNLLRNHRRPNR